MEQTFSNLIEKVKKYSTNCDFDLLEKAYNVSRKAHEGQQRKSGEPYVMHPLEVAHILTDLELDCESLVAGILHDTIEDTAFTYEEIKDMFGEEIALLVDGVTKLSKIPYTSKEEQQVENLRKMFLAMAKDIRVILIKLADRLHNMRTLTSMPEDKQREKALETLQIYAPLAHRLGISKIKWELEDISLRYLDPIAYYDIVENINLKRKEREEYLDKIIEELQKKLVELSIQGHIEGRVKHFYSIYRKMYAQNKSLDEVYDLFAARIIVNNVKDCYGVLGMVHELYKPIPGRFKDYVAMPKPNMYQSLHSTVIGPNGFPFEIQIRTWEMHRISEYGIAAHWKYKEGKTKQDDFDSKLAWLRRLLEIQRDLTDAEEFMQTLKIDLFADEVFVFTPKGDVINLPAGSTPIDFAYSIHSAVGNRMNGAKVNGKIVPLEYKLKNGDIIEVLTSTVTHGPSRDWLKIAKTNQAKNKINQWFKKVNREENIEKGKELVEKELKKHNLKHSDLFKEELVSYALKKYSYNTLDDLYANIGYGSIPASKIVSRLQDEYKKNIKTNKEEIYVNEEIIEVKPRKNNNNGIIVKGVDNCLVRLARCCNPVPGDSIIGYITKGRGVTVHKTDCPNIMNNEVDNRLIDVQWERTDNERYPTALQLLAYDRKGLLADITMVLTDININLLSMNTRSAKNNIAVVDIVIETTGTEHLKKTTRKLESIKNIFEVRRGKN